jgi:hypothetical protein
LQCASSSSNNDVDISYNTINLSYSNFNALLLSVAKGRWGGGGGIQTYWVNTSVASTIFSRSVLLSDFPRDTSVRDKSDEPCDCYRIGGRKSHWINIKVISE